MMDTLGRDTIERRRKRIEVTNRRWRALIQTAIMLLCVGAAIAFVGVVVAFLGRGGATLAFAACIIGIYLLNWRGGVP